MRSGSQALEVRSGFTLFEVVVGAGLLLMIGLILVQVLIPSLRATAESQRRAGEAIESGRFDAEIIPVEIPRRTGDPLVVDRDEHPVVDEYHSRNEHDPKDPWFTADTGTVWSSALNRWVDPAKFQAKHVPPVHVPPWAQLIRHSAWPSGASPAMVIC